jgi:hypothetical protein
LFLEGDAPSSGHSPAQSRVFFDLGSRNKILNFKVRVISRKVWVNGPGPKIVNQPWQINYYLSVDGIHTNEEGNIPGCSKVPTGRNMSAAGEAGCYMEQV